MTGIIMGSRFIVAHEEISLYVGIIMVNFFLLVRWVGLRDWQDLPT